ncbi:type III-B CRISPR module-associated Cmr3 family protein [Thiofilum flexile]|uniref:type III-B CRISPR module-associated Cmr3 family protein n=1 Tax=Thiofilum flexile TaxID=125627 RepID=UPI0003795FD9|nr:hypothetical protein [Thiofilum flexile]
MDIHTYHLKLTFKGPLLSQASGTLALGIDSAMLRDQDGKPILGGSLIRGNIRETLTLFALRLQEVDPNRSEKIYKQIRRWFGQASSNKNETSGFTPDPGSVQFDLFWQLQGDYAHNRVRTRIKIDSTGKVEDGALQVIEDCFPLGTEPVFCGRIRAQFKDADEAALFDRLITMALDYIPAMGSFKGIGFGKLLKAELVPDKSASDTSIITDDLSGQENHVGFSFVPDRAFCMGKPRTPDSNRIISDDIITGNVIKALLAKALTLNMPTEAEQQERLTALEFDRWQVSHCLPMQKEDSARRHSVIPLSIARVGDITTAAGKTGVYRDLSQVDAETLLEQSNEAPKFQPDWKSEDYDALNAQLGINPKQPKRKLLVRTAINSSTQTAAQGQLFSMECVEPEGFVWRGNIDLSLVPEDKQAAARQDLHKVMQEGLYGMGKTKAALSDLKLHPQPFPTHQNEQINTSRWQAGDTITLMLLTPARLFRLGWERNSEAATQTAKTLYHYYWQQVSGGSLELVNFFAQQERKGGAYHYYHFQHKGASDAKYAPEWLTVAGSVFVLKVVNANTAQEKLESWLRQGLPILERIPNETAFTWQHSSYLPEHGYGEIVINGDWLKSAAGGVEHE